MQAFYNRPAQNYVMDKTNMVQRKKLLRCALHYAIIFASTVRDPPPFQSRTHSSILLLWWNPARPPRPRFFARAVPDGPPLQSTVTVRVAIAHGLHRAIALPLDDLFPTTMGRPTVPARHGSTIALTRA